jgi:polar amino acid transport system permease protein
LLGAGGEAVARRAVSSHYPSWGRDRGQKTAREKVHAQGRAMSAAALPPRAPFPWRRVREAVQFVLVAGFVLWAAIRGAQSMGYNWQWARVPRYLYREIGGEIWLGPLLKGLIVTLEIAALALLLTVVFGLGVAILRRTGSVAAEGLSRVYIETIRNTPLLVQLYIFYFVFSPILGIDRYWTGVLCLAVFEGAFAAEIFRAGLEGVPKGQWEAARSLGLRPWRIYRHVVLPQALRLVLPPLTGLAVSLVKHSAIVSVIAVFDLTNEGRNVIADTFMTFEIWLVVAALYLAVTIPMSLGVRLLERRLKG